MYTTWIILQFEHIAAFLIFNLLLHMSFVLINFPSPPFLFPFDVWVCVWTKNRCAPNAEQKKNNRSLVRTLYYGIIYTSTFQNT